MSSLERSKTNPRFQRIDGDVDSSILDASKEEAKGLEEVAKLSELVSEALKGENIEVEAKPLASDSLPGFVMIQEDSRRMREYFSLSQQELPDFMKGKKTFVLNTNGKLTAALPKIGESDPDLAKDLILQLYELSLLSQKELEPSRLSDFVERSARLLEKLLPAAEPV